MRVQIYEWDRLSESQEMMEAQSPAFVGWFMALLLGLIASVVIWGFYGTVDVVVKAQSVVKQNDMASSVSSMMMGEVSHIHYRNGQFVEKGDVLLALDVDTLLVQQKQLQEEQVQLKREIEALKQQEQLMTADGSADRIPATGSDNGTETLKWTMQQEDIAHGKSTAQEELNQLLLLQQSVNTRKNLLPAHSLYHLKYEDYRTNVERLEAQVKDSIESYKQQLKAADAVSLSDPVAPAKSALNDYQISFLLSLEQEIKVQQDKLRTYDSSLQHLRVEVLNQVAALEQQSENVQSELEQLKISIDQGTLRAPSSGIVNEPKPLAEGDIVQPGSLIMTISPDQQSDFVMDIYIQNQDIGRIHEGQEVKYNIFAYPSKDYGYIEGKIDWINSRSSVNTDMGMNYYLAESAPISGALVDKDGNELKLKAGMAAEAQIVTHKEKAISYMLRKLSLKG